MKINTANLTKPPTDQGRSRFWLIPVAMVALFGFNSGITFADPCLGDLVKFDPVCTANDVRISHIDLGAGNPTSCLEGDPLNLTDLSIHVLGGSQERYDIGAYLATDGGNAKTGTCIRDALQPIGPNIDLGSGVGPYRNLEPGDPNDLCGDVAQGETNKHTFAQVSLICHDSNSDGYADIGTCLSWDNNANSTCTSEANVVPGTPSKCRCEPIKLPVLVPVTGYLKVVKDVVPDSAPGKFTLRITHGITVAAEKVDVGDGGILGPVKLDAGTSQNPGVSYNVLEVAGTGTNLGDYTSSILCTDGTTSSGAGPVTVTVTVLPTYTEASPLVCTITNTLKTGSLKILKTVKNDDNATLPASFTINYDCGGTYKGSVSVPAAGSQTVSNIPKGSVCTVTEPALTPITGYTWGTPVITGSPATIGDNTTVEVSVANSITRDRGNFKISKTTSNPDGATLPTFTGTYNCGTGYTGNWSVVNGSSQTISDIPTGNTCTVTEDALTPITGYTWGTPTITPTSVVIDTKGGTFEIVVGNSITRDRGNFTISKTTSNPDGATLPTFTGTYNCGTGYTGNWSVANGGSQTISGIPTGNTCSVTEDPLVAIPGYTWGAATYTPASIQITTKDGTFEIAVANSITRDRGNLTITKSVSNPDGATLPAAFTGTYDCGTGYTGNWSIAAGGSQTISNIPTGSTCSVNETAPVAIPGYTWGTPTFTPTSIVISSTTGTFQIVVGNSITQDKGIIEVIKKTVGGDGTFAFNSNFGVSSLTTSGGTASQTVIVATGAYGISEQVPGGWILTSASCVSTDANRGSFAPVSFALNKAEKVTCTFENTLAQNVTRTQGFWSTHPQLTDIAWLGGTAFGHTFPGVASTPGIGDTLICGRPVSDLGKVLGGFWSNVAQKTTRERRSSLDQARMQLLQQLLAAELNASAFGSSPAIGSFSTWETALCGTNITAIRTAQSQAATFNTMWDGGSFTPGTSAEAAYARSIAERAFWDKIVPPF